MEKSDDDIKHKCPNCGDNCLVSKGYVYMCRCCGYVSIVGDD